MTDPNMMTKYRKGKQICTLSKELSLEKGYFGGEGVGIKRSTRTRYNFISRRKSCRDDFPQQLCHGLV